MGKTAVFFNHHAVADGVIVASGVFVLHGAHQLDGAVLIAHILAVLERHVKKTAFNGLEYLVETTRVGDASVGNWALPRWSNDPHFAVRNFNGSLDEFMMFGAALSAEEIRRLYTDGKP